MANGGQTFDPVVVVFLAIPFFAGVWIFGLLIFSWVSVWYELVSRYGQVKEVKGRVFHFVSLKLGLIWYRGCVKIKIGEEAVGISLSFLWRPFHAPLFIPWNEVVHCELARILFARRTDVFLGSQKTRLRLWGAAGKAIYEQWTKRTVSVSEKWEE